MHAQNRIAPRPPLLHPPLTQQYLNPTFEIEALHIEPVTNTERLAVQRC